MKAIQRGPTRDELDARVRELRLHRWRRRSVAAIATAALAASTITPAISFAEPGGWGPSESTASSGETSGYGSSTSDSIGSGPPSAAMGDVAGPAADAGPPNTTTTGSPDYEAPAMTAMG